MSGHTPAPWSLWHNENGGFTVTINAPEGAAICSRNDWYHRASESIANAHLISAAPDLLAALQECMPCMGWRNMSDDELEHEHELGNGFAKPILRARAAIRKAEGNVR